MKQSLRKKKCHHKTRKVKTITLLSLSSPPTQMNVERRLFTFRFGDPRARMNWVHVDNLVLAHTLAAEALTLQRSHVSVSQEENTYRSVYLDCFIICF